MTPETHAVMTKASDRRGRPSRRVRGPRPPSACVRRPIHFMRMSPSPADRGVQAVRSVPCYVCASRTTILDFCKQTYSGPCSLPETCRITGWPRHSAGRLRRPADGVFRPGQAVSGGLPMAFGQALSGACRSAQRLATSACLARTASAAVAQRGQLGLGQVPLDHPADAGPADLGLHAQVDARDPVLAVHPGAHRHDRAGVLGHGAGHPGRGRGRGVVRRTGLEQADDLGRRRYGSGRPGRRSPSADSRSASGLPSTRQADGTGTMVSPCEPRVSVCTEPTGTPSLSATK